jgi:RHS repeat-associated protein
VADYDYDAASRLTKTTFGNGTEETRVYDTLNRLKELTSQRGTTVLSKYVYTLDKVGNRKTATETVNGQNRSLAYTYDDLYRLTDEVITDGVNGNRTSNYTYDFVGNRQTKTINGVTTTYAYDGNDRLRTEKVGSNVTATYDYDNNGSTTQKVENGVTTTYVWNDEKRLVSATVGSTQVEYAYNDQGIRVSSKQNGVETRYLLDEGIVANVWEEYAPNGTVQTSYVYGHDLITQTQAGQTSYYLVDGLGSTRLLTDTQGQVLNAYGYEAFGESTSQSGTASNKYQYAGEQFDAALGDYYLRQRFYDTSSGRFGRMDTYSGNSKSPATLNKYTYGNSNPISYTDPTGYFSLQEFSATLAAISFLETIFPTALFGAGILLRGFPESVGFGFFLSGGPSAHVGPVEFEGIGGVELAFNPQKKQVKGSLWGGVESLIKAGGGAHSLLGLGWEGASTGVYEAAYWHGGNETFLDNFSLAGATLPTGHFVGGTIAPGLTGEQELLFGYGLNSEVGVDVFQISAGTLAQSIEGMSKSTMLGYVGVLEAAFSAGSGVRSGNFFTSGSRMIGNFAGALLNAGLFATWINMTYGKDDHH